MNPLLLNDKEQPFFSRFQMIVSFILSETVIKTMNHRSSCMFTTFVSLNCILIYSTEFVVVPAMIILDIIRYENSLLAQERNHILSMCRLSCVLFMYTHHYLISMAFSMAVSMF